VAATPADAAQSVVAGWGQRFERLLIHVDLDVLDFADMPLAENTRRNAGLTFDQLTVALRALLSAPNWAALTICELNPDHGLKDGETLRTFVAALTDAIGATPRFGAVGAG
jgi:arginase